ncbi:MAG TPA: hypothetical protein VNG70_11935 [Candidatus Limnocylindria bacterium]|nr:hypothetical protein [Candidatus Limnocylindria bacterium]
MIGGIMLAVLMLFIEGFQDPDFWWHLRVGRWMVDNAKLPSVDLFTFTVPDHVWTDHEYLTEALMWFIYSAAGTVGLAIVFGLVTWAGFWLIYRQVKRQPFVIVGLGLALGALAGWPIWGPRAQMITFALTCLELYWIHGYLSGRSRALNFFPVVMAIWANLHGGWVIGFVWLGVALVAELIGWAWDRSNPAHRRHVRFLAIIGAASLVAVLATPHGFSLYLYPFQTQGSVAQQKLIVEWFSPDFHQIYLRPFEAMVFIVIAGFALRRPSLHQFLLVISGLGLAFQSVRHVALFVAAATPVMIAVYSDYWKELATSRGWKLRLPARTLFAAITGGVLVLVLGVTLLKIYSDVSPAVQQKLDASSYPIGAADWLAAHPEVGTRMYNQYGWGGYLAYRFYPDPNRRVFIFGEAELMGDPLLNQYNSVQNLRPDWQSILDQYQVDYIIFNKGEALSNVLATQPEWKLAYQDDVAVIYVRTRPQ